MEWDTVRFETAEHDERVGFLVLDRPAVLNAANEIAVAAFLDRRLDFLGIAEVVESTLERLAGRSIPDLESVLALDQEARSLAQEAQARQAAVL